MEKNGETSMGIEWNEKSIRQFCKYLYEIVDFENCLALEKEIRMEADASDRMKSHGHHHNGVNNGKTCECTDTKADLNLSTYKFKKDEDDIIGELLDNEKEEESIKKNIPYITEKAFNIYYNVMEKAKKDKKEPIDAETDNFLRTDIFKIIFTKIIINNVQKKIKQLHCKNTKDITGLANPLNIRDYSLNTITNETMSSLMKTCVAVQNNFMGKTHMELIYKELEFIEFSNQFNEHNKAYKDIRTDFYCWAYINSLDRERQKGLYKLLKELALIPFELNKKANLSLQISTLFQFSYFAPNKSFLKKHFQGGYGKLDSGKKITLIYIPYVHPKEEVVIKVYKSGFNETKEKQENAETENKEKKKSVAEKESKKTDMDDTLIMVLKPQSDTLLLLQTRNTTYEISKTQYNFFVINFWISGPIEADKTL